jgi:hypothetical protein
MELVDTKIEFFSAQNQWKLMAFYHLGEILQLSLSSRKPED